jgi:glycosyltransferase involved in cell wall biosynthesis
LITSSKPLISIGLPVYNGYPKIMDSLNSALEQTYENLEIIISDNGSTDDTYAFCKKKSLEDKRIKFIHQENHLDADKNFEFVMRKSKGEYFMWLSHDDKISKDYIKSNYLFLKDNLDYSFSGGINYFNNQPKKINKYNSFSITGDIYNRYIKFLKICWFSHGCFYALIRKKYLQDFNFNIPPSIAIDWMIDVHLLSCGSFNRNKNNYIIMSIDGTSTKKNFYFKNNIIRLSSFIPLSRFNYFFTNKLVELNNFDIYKRYFLKIKLFKVNIQMFYKMIKILLKS